MPKASARDANRATLSVCVITYDEERNLADCLASVAWADELIVVDSHSRDATREIAARFTDRVFERDWPGHVAQKNWAADQARCDWILAIDADERVSPELRASIEAALASPSEMRAYRFPRKTFYLERWWTRGGWYPDHQLRLWKRGCARWGGVDPHDRIETSGPCETLEGDLLHYSYRGIEDHLRTVNFFTSVAARAKTDDGLRFSLAALLLRPPARFVRSYFFQGAWREGIAGFVMAAVGAFYVFLKYAKLWEHQKLGHDAPLERR